MPATGKGLRSRLLLPAGFCVTTVLGVMYNRMNIAKRTTCNETLLLADWSSFHLDLIAQDRGLKRLAASLYEFEEPRVA